MAQSYVHRMSLLAQPGEQIYIYIHARTNQVVYSLKRTLQPGIIKKQLVVTGKKSLPEFGTMRKDMWRPLATVFFPSSKQGQDAFQKLREFRKRHEFEREEGDPLLTMEKKKRGRMLRDQKANAVADLAAVMEVHEKKAEEHKGFLEDELKGSNSTVSELEAKVVELLQVKKDNRDAYMKDMTNAELKMVYKDAKKKLMKVKAELKRVQVMVADNGGTHTKETVKYQGPLRKTVDIGGERRTMFTMEGVRIQWSDITNAEFAQTWPAGVVHDTMPMEEPRARHVHTSSVDPLEIREEPTSVEPQEVVVEAPVARRKGKIQQGEGKEGQLGKLVRRLQFGRQQ